MVARFGSFTLDAGARTLQQGTCLLHLSPKAFDLLALLVHRRPQALAKADIHQHLWPDTFVSDGNVAVLVAEIRRALGERAREARFVRTVQRFGYAFVGPVQGGAVRSGGLARQPASCWLAWGTHRAAVTLGENVVGRDPAADVWIDAVGVSRRHAMIVVSGEEVTLADLASKNGTFVEGIRVTAPVALRDDTDIRLGPVPVRFCRPPADGSTETWHASRSGSAP